MLPKRSGPEVAGNATQQGQDNRSQRDCNRPEKWRRILSVLASGRRLTRFDAEREGDHCLHSTVSYIEKRGVRVERADVVVLGRFGPVRCKRYWIADDPNNITAAEMVIGGCQLRRQEVSSAA
jgi:hypothetical protein